MREAETETGSIAAGAAATEPEMKVNRMLSEC